MRDTADTSGVGKRLSLAERETIIRFDDDERVLHLYTSSPTMARRWQRRGIPLTLTRDGASAQATVPLEVLRPLRAMQGGDVKRRKNAK